MIESLDTNGPTPQYVPWYQQSIYADKSVKPVSFNSQKAPELLRAEGWKDLPTAI